MAKWDYPRAMPPLVWDEWPQFFRGRLRVEYECTGQVMYRDRPPFKWNAPKRRRARIFVDEEDSAGTDYSIKSR
jgi:hypothetical protein